MTARFKLEKNNRGGVRTKMETETIRWQDANCQSSTMHTPQSMGYLHYFAMLHGRPALLGGSVNIVKMLVVEVPWQSIADWTRLLDMPSSGVRLFASQFDSKKERAKKKKSCKKSTFGTFGAFSKSTVPMHFTLTSRRVVSRS